MGRNYRWALVALLLVPLLAAGIVAGRTARYNEAYFHYPRVAAEPPADLVGLLDVSFRTDDGLTLRGWYLPSQNRAGMVLVHGLTESRAQLLPEARTLAAAGFGVLLFDLRAHGESEGETSTWGDLERRDVTAALAFARAQPDLDPARVGLLGFSIGAGAVSAVAANDPQVPAVALLSPFNTLYLAATYDVRKWGRVGRVGALLPFWRRGIAFDAVQPIEDVSRILPRPLLVIVGAKEAGQPLVDELFAKVEPRGQTWRVIGAGHGGFAAVEPVKYPATIRAFFVGALLPAGLSPEDGATPPAAPAPSTNGEAILPSH